MEIEPPVPNATDIDEKACIYDGLSIQLTPAPFAKRFFAYAVDLGIVMLVTYCVILAGILVFGAGLVAVKSLVGDWLNGAGAVMIIVAFIVFFLIIASIHDGYFIYFEFKKGVTPGKGIFGLKVVSVNGARLTLGQAVLRQLFRYVDVLLIFPGPIAIAATEKKQRIGDLVASTLVVHSAQRENKQDYLYVRAEQYQWMLETLQPGIIALDACRTYLTFSYPEYIMQSQRSSEANLRQWEDWVKYYVPKAKDCSVDKTMLLRLFAEYCFQTVNKSSEH